MADTTLRQAFSDIANAIRAKGVTGTMTPLQMPTKIGTIYASKYGVSGDSVIGNVDQNGELQPPSTSFTFQSSDILSIPINGLYNKFYRNPALTEVNLPNLTTVGNYGMDAAFEYCTSLTTVDLSKVTGVGQYGIAYAFYGDTALKTIYLSSLSSAGSNGMNLMCHGCTALELVDFSEATAVPALSNVNAFSNTNNTYSIVVPDSLYSSWIAASNWSDATIVGHIVKASEYTPAS